MNTIYYDAVNECFCDDDDDRSLDEDEYEEIMNIPMYRMMKDLFETICANKYELFSGQYIKFCQVMNESENEDEFLGNLTFEEEYVYEWYAEQKYSLILGTNKPNLKTYVELLTAYNIYTENYHRLVALKNNTKLNNDLIFNSIIGYL